MPDYAAQRLTMVETQIRTNDVTDVRIHEAMRTVPRERFVSAAKRALAYSDTEVELVSNRYLLEPRVFAKLVQLAEIGASDKILDVGCATGYDSAVLARIGAKVFALEEDADLVRVASDMLPAVGASNATVVQGALAQGHKQAAPYDVIFISGGVEVVPDMLLHQLAEGGRLVAVIRKGPQGRATVFVKGHGRIGSRPAFDASAPLLAGFREPVGFTF
jgi:protein-L-isoaspartate(D-aspartate) O-methyltransferase